MSTKTEILAHPSPIVGEVLCFAYLTRKASDEFLNKKLEKMLDSAGVIYYKQFGTVFVTLPSGD